ncbi:MarR family transcriptional regulator [Fusibacter paucivorans]|uniref:MarR family transcriptional regulator n=1 Tax=Fusibacter paucivorans TaxID=76009 RepID=A0ABS5PLU1_9FIRM|nr:MarR family transcriptional regulator [Fusibacter paucivorans]
MNEKLYEEIMENLLIFLPLLNKKFFREDEIFKSDVLFPSHIQILLTLSSKRQMTMSEISRQINVINSNLTPLVDKLIKGGYLKRQTSKKDRRVVYISITAQGKHYIQKHKMYVTQLLEARFENLDEAQLKSFSEHLQGMLDIIHAAMPEA